MLKPNFLTDREKNKGNEAKANLNATLLSESSELSDLHNPVEMAKVKADELFEQVRSLTLPITIGLCSSVIE